MSLDPRKMISPNLQEFFIDSDTNLPLTGGFVYYYSDIARSTLKTIYELTGTFGSYSFTALPNPLELSGAGTTINGSGQDTRVYYYPYDDEGNIENYYINVTDSFGNSKLQRQAWPNLAEESTDIVYAYSFSRNSTFYAWDNGTVFNNVKSGSQNLTDFIFNDWTYSQDDVSQQINISRGTFIASDNAVPNNPPYYLIYENVTGGASGTFNRFQQTYKSVKTLSGQEVSVSIWLNQISPSGPAPLTISLTQSFGSGGSTAVSTTMLTVPIITVGTWTQYSATATLPNISGKTIGTGDQLILSINMPLNLSGKIYLSTIPLQQGPAATSLFEQSNDDIQKQTNAISLYPAFTTSDAKITLKKTSDVGWLLMDDGTIGNMGSGATHIGFSYYNLYQTIWNNVNNSIWAPLFTSAGVYLPAYGASAEADWQAGNQLSLTKVLGRSLVGAAPLGSAMFKVFTADPATDLLTANDTSSLFTGMPCAFVTTGTLPAPLVTATVYYIIQVDSTNFKVATTLDNAMATPPVPIDITTAGTGVHNLSIEYAAYALGQFLGQPSHNQIESELHKHHHPSSFVRYNVETFSSGDGGVLMLDVINGDTNSKVIVVTDEGGNAPSNIIQPSSYWNVMIKL